MPRKNPTEPQAPTPAQLVQEYIDSLLREGADELGLKAPGDIARVLDRLNSTVTDFALREREVDEETVHWLKRQGKTALSSAKVRNLGRISRAQVGAINVATGAAKLALAALLAQITPGTTLARFAQSS